MNDSYTTLVYVCPLCGYQVSRDISRMGGMPAPCCWNNSCDNLGQEIPYRGWEDKAGHCYLPSMEMRD